MLIFGGVYTLTVALMRVSSVKLGTAGFDGDSGILAGIVVSVVGLLVSIYATAKKIDLGPVEIQQEAEKPAAPETPAAESSDVVANLKGPVTTIKGAPIGGENGTESK